MPFDPGRLREARKLRGVALKQLAARLDISTAQVQRLERGERRLTLDMFMSYCEALGLDAVDLLQARPSVPVIGVINRDLEVVPLAPNTPHETLAPRIVFRSREPGCGPLGWYRLFQCHEGSSDVFPCRS